MKRRDHKFLVLLMCIIILGIIVSIGYTWEMFRYHTFLDSTGAHMSFWKWWLVFGHK